MEVKELWIHGLPLSRITDELTQHMQQDTAGHQITENMKQGL